MYFFISKAANFISLKMDSFTIFARRLLMFLRVVSKFTVSIEGHLGPLLDKKWSFFDVS